METIINRGGRLLVRLLLGIAIGTLLHDLAEAAPTALAKSGPDQSVIAQRLSRAGRIRQQAHRFAKLYWQIGLRLNADAARVQLGQAMMQMDRDLTDLTREGGEGSARSLQRISGNWQEMRQIAAGSYTAGNAERLTQLAEGLAIAAGSFAMQLERTADTPTARLLDLALRQSMLVQRLARLYLMALAGDKSYGREVDMEQTRREFASSLNELIVARENTPENRERLKLARMQWVFFDNAIDGLKNGSSKPENVATTSERILETLESVCAEYARTTGKVEPQLTQAAGIATAAAAQAASN